MSYPGHWNEPSFIRKIKHHIKAGEHSWMAVVQKPFRSLGLMELEAFNLRDLRHVPSGLEFKARMHEIYEISLNSATISRFFLLLPGFSARSREELFRKTLSIPWELYINPRIPLLLKTRVRYSRLKHEGAAGKTAREAMARYFSVREESLTFRETAPGSQKVVLSIENNRCGFRLDSSGEHLHKRGYRKFGMPAPIRETTAALLLRWALSRTGMPEVFLDPLCGSGTFPIEFAALKYGAFSGCRSFNFMDWPGFQDKRFAYSLKKREEKTLLRAGKEQKGEPLGQAIFAGDISRIAVETAKKNIDSAGFAGDIIVSKGDFFSLKPADYSVPSGKTGLMVINPPYGIRLDAERGLYFKILKHWKTTYPGWALLILIPETADKEKYFMRDKAEKISFTNGGIRLSAYLLFQRR